MPAIRRYTPLKCDKLFKVAYLYRSTGKRQQKVVTWVYGSDKDDAQRKFNNRVPDINKCKNIIVEEIGDWSKITDNH